MCASCVCVWFTTEGVRTKRVESTVMDEEIHFWEVFLHCHLHIKERIKSREETANMFINPLPNIDKTTDTGNNVHCQKKWALQRMENF